MPPDRSPDSICLFLDVDGSLIDIAARPDAVTVPDSLVRDLARAAAALGGALALVSGRSIDQLDALFAPLRLRAAGVHGAELRLHGDDPVQRPPEAAVPPETRKALQAMLPAFPGVLVEDKTFSVAIHYRAVPEAGPRLIAALRGLVAHITDLVIMPGHYVVELKRPTFDKGLAVRRFLGEPAFAGRMPIFVGDDVTDDPGFAAAVAAGGEAYGVGREIPGTTGTFASPSAVRTWVGSIANEESMPA